MYASDKSVDQIKLYLEGKLNRGEHDKFLAAVDEAISYSLKLKKFFARGKIIFGAAAIAGAAAATYVSWSYQEEGQDLKELYTSLKDADTWAAAKSLAMTSLPANQKALFNHYCDSQ